MRILIESIPHKNQRYDTCGDYYETAYHLMPSAGHVLHVRVSELPDKREMLLIAIHELIEWAICDAKGITNEQIDKFDLNYGKGHCEEHKGYEYDCIDCADTLATGSEPGDSDSAPYYTQHQIATGIERIVAAEMGVSWQAYERHIEELKR